ETSVVTRWRRMFSSTTTQLSLMSGFSASNFFESFFNSIIAGLLTAAMVMVFVSARRLVTASSDATSRRNVLRMTCWDAEFAARSPAGVAAIHHEVAPGEIAARVRRQKQHRARDFGGLADAVHRREVQPFLAPRLVFHAALGHLGGDVA